jgi:hypothetical protein
MKIIIANMIKENEIVTKTYLRDSQKDFVTKKHLTGALKEQKIEIIREVRTMMHETMEGAVENMKEYYIAETNRHTSTLMQGFKDEMRYYKDEMKTFMERLDNHENRITTLERPAL